MMQSANITHLFCQSSHKESHILQITLNADGLSYEKKKKKKRHQMSHRYNFIACFKEVNYTQIFTGTFQHVIELHVDKLGHQPLLHNTKHFVVIKL